MYLSYIPTVRNRRFKEVGDQLHTSLCVIVKKRKDAIEAGEGVNDDLLGILLDSNLGIGILMNLQEVIDECKLFYLAGQETTSILLVLDFTLAQAQIRIKQNA
ncbi:Cytochrome P450 72A11 [Bienertia sinuspersici]